ncbi:MAG TPA: glycosyl hydrolase family 28 protein [Actinocrinis sp.]|jgi:polygalacturonase|uniref:glycoside hydrolase family 28 protein n=1 Tax=Actinocrinis sp. TaxID=1920516 RepID=UPI002DDD17BB|nr:glycosyl hydrolase family 28 protein [Actinocrinis sp.]HEV3171088.1 glycosyl hydrolase family 28 protein [Actinocrinis sp.]
MSSKPDRSDEGSEEGGRSAVSRPSVSRRGLLAGGAAVLGGAAAASLAGAVGAQAAGLPRTTAAPGRLLAGRVTQLRTSAVPTLPWPAANAIVASTKLPAFPTATFPVTSYGAVGNGTTDNTAAFAKAIAACNAAGGGHVTVPAGTYLTGAIRLLSNVDLNLAGGATLKFSGDATKFPLVLTRYEGIECMNRSPMIYAHGASNIALTGSGTLDASGTAPWNVGSDRAYLETLVVKGVPPEQRIVPSSGHQMRSTFVEPYACDTVLIQGVALHNSRFWQLHPTLSTNVTIDSVTTSATNSNTDGCDPECCDHVVIQNCTLGAGDDNIAIKSGRDADGRRINTPSQNIVIVGCHMSGPWGAVSCGSELTGGIRNVYAYKIVANPTRYALYVKSNTQRGGYATNINLDSITASNQKGAFAFVTMTYNGQTGSFAPDFGGFSVTNSTGHTAPYAFDVTGLSSDPVHGITASNCTFTNISHGADVMSHVTGIAFSNVTINGKTVTK